MAAKNDKTAKIVFCYAEEDKGLGDELERHLEALKRSGKISVWHHRNILPGSEWEEETTLALNEADLILLLISPDFLASDYCYTVEVVQALKLQEEGKVRVVPILLRPVDYQDTPFASLQPLPANKKPITLWPSRDKALNSVTRRIRSIVEDLHLTSKNSITPFPYVWMVPLRRNPFFTGRERLLTRLHKQFSIKMEPQALTGLGGIGKTQIAIEYAYRYHTEYRFVLWIRASNRNVLLSHLKALASVLRLPKEDALNEESLIKSVKSWLSTHDKWLLIIDNADELTMVNDFLPGRGIGHVLLITCNQATGNIATQINVEKMSLEEGARLLLKRAKMLSSSAALKNISASVRTEANAIAAELDGLPLALDQAGAYIDETKCSLRHYHRLLKEHRQYLLQRRGQPSTDHPDSVCTTILLAYKEIRSNQIAIDILYLCVFLASDAIAEDVLLAGITPDRSLIDAGLRGLLKYSLVRRHPKTKTLSMHRLVQTVIQDEMGQKLQQQWAERTVRAVGQVLPDMEVLPWPDCLDVLPNEIVYAAIVDDHGIRFSDAAQLLARAGYELQKHTQQAERFLRGTLDFSDLLVRQEKPFPSYREAPKWMYKLIMVIDDSFIVRKILETTGWRKGFEVVTFNDGLEALKWLSSPDARIPDLIFLDIGLPRMDGYEVARHIKSKQEFEDTVIIMLSRRDGVIDRLKSRLAGSAGHITKPFRTQEIISMVEAHIGLPNLD